MSAAGSGLTLIGASAGSGKTHRLTQVVTEAVDPSFPDPIRVEELFAVTYTRKGAAELDARIRLRLAESGEFERSQNLPLACIGTVHSVCLRLVKEFAVDAGLSPRVEAMPGNETRFLREVLERGLPPDLKSRVERLGQSLEIRFDPKRKRVDWITPVQDIMTLARGNRIAPESLPEMGRRSAAGLLRILGPAEPDGAALEAELMAALERSAAELGRVPIGVQKTAKALEVVQDALGKARRGRLEWSDWVRLGKVEPAVAVDAAVAPLREVARRVDVHPRLQAELGDFTVAAFEAARVGLEAYDEWKKRRRIVDFVDMIDRALALLECPGVRDEIAARYRLLVVDEFQDTSPVQLALFLRIHALAKRSTWVGDRKQCIFEYAGADPALMEAVTGWARDAGGRVEQLPRNWRSRPELVALFSRLFTAAMERHDYRPDEVVMQAQRTTTSGMEKLPPLGLWWLDVKSEAGDAEAIASGIARLLAAPEETPVVDRATGEVRAVRGGDVAVLVATNRDATAVSKALAACGMMAAIARAGLFRTPEGVLVRAALRLLVDPRDSLSRAEVELLVGLDGSTPDDWLERLIADTDAYRDALDNGVEPPSPVLSREALILERIARGMSALSPAEVLDEVLSALDLLTLAARWPDPEQRAGNLDALRALTRTYEEHCLKHGETATVAGLVRYFDEASEEVLVRDEEIASDDQHVRLGHFAVTVTTYHKAKGLEWPVVILSSLNRAPRRDAFEVSPESDAAVFDASEPLRGRWIRYFPQPYGVQRASPLADRVAVSAEGRAVAVREERERVRLLYVGFTRARDHLVLVARTGKDGPKVAWLDDLSDGSGGPLLDLPADVAAEELASVGVRGNDGQTVRVPARHWRLGQSSGGIGTASVRPRWFAAAPPRDVEPAPLWIAPSRAAVEWPELVTPTVGEAESTGPRLPLGQGKGVDWDVVGNTLHAFLAADVPDLDPAERLDCARRLLAASNLEKLLGAEALLQSGDNLRRWVEKRWPGATWHREVSIDSAVATTRGERRVSGTIDLLLEVPAGVVLIDHKSYPGGMATWRERAAMYAAQIGAYVAALEGAGRPVVDSWLSFAVAGGAVRILGVPGVRGESMLPEVGQPVRG